MTGLNDEQFYAMVTENILNHDVHLTGVFGTEDDPSPNFTYTTGLVILNSPELIVFGLSMDHAGTILNTLTQRVKNHDTVLVPGKRDDVLVGYDVWLIEITDKGRDEHMTVAGSLALALDLPMRALQIVWPDKWGNFPWDIDYNYPPGIQPVLGPMSGDA